MRSSKTGVSLNSLAVIFVLLSSLVYGIDKDQEEAQRALRRGDFVSAESIFTKLVAKNGRNLNARLGLSFSLLKQQKLDEAFEHARRAALIDPRSSRAHAIIGQVLLSAGYFTFASNSLKLSLSINPNEAMAVAGLAMIDFYENRIRASVEGLRRAVSLQRDEPDYLFNLAQAAARSEQYKEAADAYERFLQIAPTADNDRRARIRGLIDFLRYLGRRGPIYSTGGEDRVSIPFELIGGRPYIRVQVNNSSDYMRFVLDTGSGMSVISDVTAKRLGVEAVARGGIARAVGGGGGFEIIYGLLDSVKIGEARIDNIPVYIRKFYHTREPVDGYIGLSMMIKYLTTIDYGQKIFSLRREDKESVKEQNMPLDLNEIPLRTTSSGFLSGEIRIEGIDQPQNFIIDTGSSITVFSQTLANREEVGRFAKGSRTRVYGAAGVAENVPSFIIPRVMLGAHARTNLEVVVLDLKPINETTGFEQTGILGGNFLRNFRIIFNFNRATLKLEPLMSEAQKATSRG
jgi:tetratricopeptide (TPR) repeat protein